MALQDAVDEARDTMDGAKEDITGGRGENKDKVKDMLDDFPLDLGEGDMVKMGGVMIGLAALVMVKGFQAIRDLE